MAAHNQSLTNMMIKKAMGTLAPLVAVLAASMINLSHFQTPFKMSKVKMLHKKGSRQVLKNYRPIALLSVLGKIFESMLTNKLVRQLKASRVLDNSQFGFRVKCGCHSALLSLWQGVSQAVKTHKGCSMIDLDLTKAFDMANHQVLLDKLASCNCLQH